MIYEIAQRLADQPLGRFRISIAILVGKYKRKLNVFSLSLGQVAAAAGWAAALL
jgi:hypothetical protein